MLFKILGDAVVVVHFAFLLFVGIGAVLAWRWPTLLWAHLGAVAWSVASLTVGLVCPLTVLEKWLRELGGGRAYEGGFIDHYLEGAIYPARYSVPIGALGAAAVVVGYVGLRRGARVVSPLSAGPA